MMANKTDGMSGQIMVMQFISGNLICNHKCSSMRPLSDHETIKPNYFLPPVLAFIS